MAEMERMREKLAALPTAEYFQRRQEEGWSLAAVEWERPAAGEAAAGRRQDVPYGLRVAADCQHLEEDPTEMRALERMLALIADDLPLSQVAEGLNREGFRLRGGGAWTQVEAFNMLPRLIEAAPQIRGHLRGLAATASRE